MSSIRLPRNRRGKTPIDVTFVEQDGNKRVRLTMGDDNRSKKNSDLTADEVVDLMALLNYHHLVLIGDYEDEDTEDDEDEVLDG